MKFTLTKLSSTIGLAALLLAATLTTAIPAQAQNGDTWKSIAIIGGSTAAGAIIGHKIAGRTGMAIGAAAGATAGYAIDRHRRNNEYNNGHYGYYGGNNNGYYGSNDPYYGNGAYAYPPQYQYPDNSSRVRHSRRR